MNILLYGINYSPELTGIGKYSGEMGSWLQSKGHQVQMVTGFPYYPQWEIRKPYKGNWWKTDNIDGVKVTRCPLYVPKERSAIRRIIHEGSFLLTSTLALIGLLFKKVDVMVCVVTPFHLGLAAVLFSKLKGIPLVYHVQDLQVDAARDLGMIQHQSLIKRMESLERWIMRKADVVSTISEGMRQKIKAKGFRDEKLFLFPNWVDRTVVFPLTKKDSLRAKWGFKATDRLVMYAGNLGEKQGLEAIIQVANRLRNQSDLHFIIVGEGGGKTALQQAAKDQQLTNVHFFPLQPYKQLAAMLATPDLHLVLQKRAAADLVMPSKLTSILAVGGVAVVTAEPETTLYQVLDRYELGVLVPPEDLDALHQSITTALEQDLEAYQKNALYYAQQYLDKETILSQFESFLSSLTLQNHPIPKLSKKP